jgi:hypothetical protein
MPTPTELASHAERFDEADWTEFLEAVWNVARRRRESNHYEDEPTTADRELIVEWVARRHLSVDPGLSEVHFLPEGAPADEIRLVEVNEMSAGALEGDLRPIDFGLDVANAHFRLVVVDADREQLERARRDPSSLPDGWGWRDSRNWSRRA